MVWIVVIVLYLLAVSAFSKINKKVAQLEKQNEKMQEIINAQNKQLKIFKNSFELLPERFAYKPHFEKEQLKIEQVRIDLRDFQDFYQKTLSDEERDRYFNWSWGRQRLDDDDDYY